MWIILSEFKGFCMFIRLKLLLPLANSLIFTQLNWIRFHLAPCLSIYFNAQVPCIRNLTWTRWTWTISWSLIEFADQQLTRFFFHPFGLGRFSMELNGFCVPVRIDRVTQYCYVLFFCHLHFSFPPLTWNGRVDGARRTDGSPAIPVAEKPVQWTSSFSLLVRIRLRLCNRQRFPPVRHRVGPAEYTTRSGSGAFGSAEFFVSVFLRCCFIFCRNDFRAARRGRFSYWLKAVNGLIGFDRTAARWHQRENPIKFVSGRVGYPKCFSPSPSCLPSSLPPPV